MLEMKDKSLSLLSNMEHTGLPEDIFPDLEIPRDVILKETLLYRVFSSTYEDL